MPVINGTPGADQLFTTADYDVINADEGDDTVTIQNLPLGSPGEEYHGGGGYDLLVFDNTVPGFYGPGAPSGFYSFTFHASSGRMYYRVNDFTVVDPAATFDGFERYNIYMNASSVTIDTANGDDIVRIATRDGGVIRTYGGNDAIYGPSSGDTGFYQYYGGTGNDDYYLNRIGATTIVENAGEGIDTVYLYGFNDAPTLTFALPTNVERLLVDPARTPYAYVLTDNAGNNEIRGASLNDTIDASNGGNDSLYGDGGDDGFRFLNGTLDSADYVNGGAGNDTVSIQGNFNGAAPTFVDVETLLLGAGANYTMVAGDTLILGTGTLTVNGLALAAGNVLAFDGAGETGGNFVVYGGAGNDTITGGVGNDLLAGNGGTNLLAGGIGDDTYVIASGTDVIVERPFEGHDTVYAAVSYALTGNAAVEAISTQSQQGVESINLIGNYYAQQVIGNFGNNVLNGNGGADTLIGLKGNDIYAIADANAVIVENPGEGHDIVYTSVGYTLTGLAEIEELSFATQAGAENMNIIGNGYNQNVVGNFGNNVLNGNGGIDTLIGLRGDDIYVVGNSASVVQENAGEGNDTVFTSVSYTLAAGVSVETLSTQTQGETGAINLKGNEVAQLVIGNYGDNLIDGGAGSDTLYGLYGVDTFAFSTALGAANIDTIADFESGSDRIQLSASVFTGLATGTLATSSFGGATATTPDQRILYDQATGRLFFDADGSGAAAALQFATVTAGTTITAAMISVV